VQLSPENQRWLDSFKVKNGRPPSILHIGNIANNAYLNARMLNEAGFDCDVICYDYYHTMGCPEWEDADFEGNVDDQFRPDWSKINLNGFERPRWFAQGPQKLCIEYLVAKRSGNSRRAEHLWQELGYANKTKLLPTYTNQDRLVYYCLRLRQKWAAIKDIISKIGCRSDAFSLVWSKLAAFATNRGPIGWLLSGTAAPFAMLAVFLMRVRMKTKVHSFTVIAGKMQRSFAEAFPDRSDQLTFEDCEPYASMISDWKRLLDHYDIVQGYATDGVIPLLCGKREYFTYEHGTIRNIPFESTSQGRLCALSYRQSCCSFITNCDNINAAKRLGLKNFQFLPHPVNESKSSKHIGQPLRLKLCEELDCDFLVFQPSRQHWESCRHPDWEKGNDIFIRGLADFIHHCHIRTGVIFVDWGQTVDQSKKLIEELGIASRVKWIAPLPNRRMIGYINASDLVADQFYLGAFGSLTPKALYHCCPVMLYLNERLHQWCFPEMPPIINARTKEEVYEGMARLIKDKEYRELLIQSGSKWYDKYHSNNVIAQTFTAVANSLNLEKSTSANNCNKD
jgi:hypothetical protein